MIECLGCIFFPRVLRAANSNDSYYFYKVYTNGGQSDYIAGFTTGVAPAFRIG